MYSCLVRTASDRTAKQPPRAGVQQGREHRWRVEPRQAAPVDRPVGGHQCRRVQVADDSMILDGRVTVRHDTSLEARLPDGEPTLSASRRLSRAFASTVTAANSTDAGPLAATIMSTAREPEEAAGIRRSR